MEKIDPVKLTNRGTDLLLVVWFFNHRNRIEKTVSLWMSCIIKRL